jgi:nicotinate-nucleotide adenylyltransferase
LLARARILDGRGRTGVFGGSFDPPHAAHVLAVTYAVSVGAFDRVLVVPVFRHAFDKRLAPFEDRVRLCELAFSGIAGALVSTVEASLPQPNYTLNTLERLHELEPTRDLALIVGSDVLSDAPRWHAFSSVVKRAPLFVLGRLGHAHPDAPPPVLPEISSTRVRALLAARDESATAELETLVPRAVLDEIRARGLYA